MGTARGGEHLFVVRFWHEGPPDSGQWRGLVVHVTSGESRYFASLADLMEFMLVQRDGP